MPGPKPTAPLGTVSSYKRAIRNGQTPSPACKAAWAAYHRDLYRKRKQQRLEKLRAERLNRPDN